jgi:glucosamine--fructose-6-phosphate aminotransferase (isomerizing)
MRLEVEVLLRVESGRLTEQEILAQPRLWAATLNIVAGRRASLHGLWQSVSADLILLTGCGSSYYLALTGGAVLQSILRTPCRVLPSSEILFAPDDALLGARAPCVIAISRSGETTETVRALEHLKTRGVPAVTLTCVRGGTLSRLADLALELPVEERSVVMTGSFTSMLLAVAALGAELADDQALAEALPALPRAGEGGVPRLVAGAGAMATRQLRSSYVYLGSGPLFGIASEGALKMTEMALLPARAYHTLEFLHGPKASVSPETLVIGLPWPGGEAYEGQVLRHVAGLGAAVVAVGGVGNGIASVELGAPAGTVPGMLLATVWLQALALQAARARNVDPDTPRFLQPVVTWEGSRILAEGR